MNWELYEVWGVDDDGHEELLETTRSRKQAFEIAEGNLTNFTETVVYLENEEGDLDEVQRFEQG